MSGAGCVRGSDGLVEEMVFDVGGSGKPGSVQQFVDRTYRAIDVAEQAQGERGVQGFGERTGWPTVLRHPREVITDRLPGGWWQVDQRLEEISRGVGRLHRLYFHRDGASQRTMLGRADRFRSAAEQDQSKRGIGQRPQHARPDGLGDFIKAVEKPGHATSGK